MLKIVIFINAVICAVNVHSLDLESVALAEWEAYKIEYGKSYANEYLDSYRQGRFLDHKKNVAAHNSKFFTGEASYKIGINQFSDQVLWGIYRSGAYGKLKIPLGSEKRGLRFTPPANFSCPDSIDWRQLGGVTPVRDQANCASCWAFSAVASLEGQSFRKTGKLVGLSKQQLVDCDKVDSGCDGGYMDTAFEFIKQNGGIATEDSYPYTGKEADTCNKDVVIGARDYGYMDIEKFNEEDMKIAVALYGPISVGIATADFNFFAYESGIFDDGDCNSSMLDHGVTIVGYGTSKEGKDYWIAKNSFGPRWGEKGYFRMARGKNQCRIAEMASFPIV